MRGPRLGRWLGACLREVSPGSRLDVLLDRGEAGRPLACDNQARSPTVRPSLGTAESAPVSESGERISNGPWRKWKSRARLAANAGLLAAVLGLLLHLRWQYSAGTQDHLVLSPMGLHWADSDDFAGDWFLEGAPQPHWLFDVFTSALARHGLLAQGYFAYWLLALFVCGIATALLAREWAPRTQLTVGVAVVVTLSAMPWWLLGTGSPAVAMALPVVLGGFLVYLFYALLLTGREVPAAMTAVAAALVHVQQGAVLLVVLLLVAVGRRLVGRGWSRALLLAAGANAIIISLVLTARPVAGGSGFLEVCELLIPYHCDATTWSWSEVLSGVALTVMALATWLLVRGRYDLEWLCSILVVWMALVGGVLADKLDIPVVGTLVQSSNLYRVAVILLPFACWGLLVPLLANASSRARLLALGVVLVSFWFLATAQGLPSSPLSSGSGWILVVAIAVVAGTVATLRAVGHDPWDARRARFVRATSVTVSGGLILAGVTSGWLAPRPFDPAFFPDDVIRGWGEEVREVVPPGGQFVAPPLATYVRITTRRGVVADCKNVPYGGAAWRSYRQRMERLGGLDQCRTLDPTTYNSLPVSQLVSAAREFDADYIVVETGDMRLEQLQRMQWKLVMGPYGSLDNRVLQAPWVGSG